jgi:hypothetical protein
VGGRCQVGKKRLLFQGGFEGYLTADGHYLFVLYTRPEVFVALISVEFSSLLDLMKASDFESYVEKVNGLDTVRFDPSAGRLTAMLNWAKTDYRTHEIIFEKVIEIEVCIESQSGT